MNSYAIITQLAIDKIELLKYGPVRAWQESANEVYPSNKDAREKSCPKCTFLGLCEEGYVKDVSKGDYTTSIKNKAYAIASLDFIKIKPALSSNELWLKLDIDIPHDAQMDVVIALYNKGFLIFNPSES